MTENERILFVTGRLAESPLRNLLETLSQRASFQYDVAVLGVSVAALLHTDLVARKLSTSKSFDRVVLPGWCQGDLEELGHRLGAPVDRGPKDLYDLPEFFGRGAREPVSLEAYDIEIVAEINHASRFDETELITKAQEFVAAGADVIDLGGVPGESWTGVEDATRLLVGEGFRVSIDSFDRPEVEAAVEGGAELVFSCDQSNVDWLARLGVELIAIPSDPHDLDSLEPTLDVLARAGAHWRIDPVLEPVGFGFAASLQRYFAARRRWPDCEMLMGVGNLTELSEVDSSGINFLLAAVCQELQVHSVLTTQVINWCRTSVSEFDLARRLVHHSVTQGVLPKHLDSQLVLLRDSDRGGPDEESLRELASRLTDPSFRIFVTGSNVAGCLHVMNRDGHWQGTDPYELFDRVLSESGELASDHAFYLGYELAKARTALTLGKRYVQDEALNWGFLSEPEISAHHRRREGAMVEDPPS